MPKKFERKALDKLDASGMYFLNPHTGEGTKKVARNPDAAEILAAIKNQLAANDQLNKGGKTNE